MDFENTAYENQDEMHSDVNELATLREKQFSNNKISRCDEGVILSDPSPENKTQICPFNEVDLCRVKLLTSNLQEAFGLFSNNLMQLGPYKEAETFMNGGTPPNEPDQAPLDSELSQKLTWMPGAFSFAVWGKVYPPGSDEPIDLVYDSDDNKTLRALEIGVAMRGDFTVDSWVVVANALHKAHVQGWAEIQADPQLGRNYVCVRLILGEGALLTMLKLQDPPQWPQKWPHRIANPFNAW